MINHPLYLKVKSDIEYTRDPPSEFNSDDTEDNEMFPISTIAEEKMLKITERMISTYSEEQLKELKIVVFEGDYGEAVMYCDNPTTTFRLVAHCGGEDDKTTLFFIAEKVGKFPWRNYYGLDFIEKDLMWIVEYRGEDT